MKAEALDLEGLDAWLEARGRSPATRRSYVSQLRSASSIQGGLERLRAPGLAPKSRRVLRAALVAYARYVKDGALETQLRDLKLPPARRVEVRTALSDVEFGALVTFLARAKPSPEKAVLQILLLRGLRLSDVLRVERQAVVQALKTGVLVCVVKGGQMQQYSCATVRDPLVYLASVRGWTQLCDLIAPESRADIRVEAAGREIRRILADAAKRAGIKTRVFPHRLRRTVATRFARVVGGDAFKLKALLGWQSIASVAEYVEVSRDEVDRDLARALVSDGKPRKPA